MDKNQSDKMPTNGQTKPPKQLKGSNAVFERRSIVFGPGDAALLDGLVRVAVYQHWPNPNRSTVIRSLIHIAAQVYADNVYPQEGEWAHHLHRALPKELHKIKHGAAKRGPTKG